MEEDIKMLEKLEFIAYGKKEDIEALGMNINIEKLDTTKIIRNLINKYKEQEKFIDWLVGYILDVDEIGYAECNGCKNDKYVGMYRSENKKCVECRIEYFKKQFQKESEDKQ